jgi:hypothetical protein
VLGAHPAVIRGHLSAAKGDHLLGGLLRPTRRMDPDGALEALLEGMYAGTASGTFPQISTSVDPVRMWVADFRERLRAGAEGAPLYGAVNLDLKLRRDLYARARLPASLNDDALMQCLGEAHAAAWLQKLYWVQMFMGGGNTGMELHRDNLQVCYLYSIFQSIFSLYSVYIQSIFSLYSVYIQSIFSLYSV